MAEKQIGRSGEVRSDILVRGHRAKAAPLHAQKLHIHHVLVCLVFGAGDEAKASNQEALEQFLSQ